MVEEFEQCMLEDTINTLIEQSTQHIVTESLDLQEEENIEEKETYLADTRCEFLKIARPVDEKYDD